LLDSIAFDTVPTYNLQQALKQDPLKVYKLSLKKMKLTEFPTEILEFKNLQSLDIQKNKFKTFPIQITAFKFLQELNISTNKIEIVTKELGQLIHLRKFTANSNRIVSLPKEIRFLKKLKYIDIWGNDIGSLPYEISELQDNLLEIDMRVILMSKDENNKIKELLPKTKIRFSKSCNCAF
jgi:Leucine-rich repeat (LRR) protein